MQEDIRHRYNTRRRDYAVRPPTPKPPAEPPQKQPKRPKRNQKPIYISIAILILIVAAGGWFVFHKTSSQAPAKTSPVPQNIKQAVSFPIYYPDAKKLPAGYTFNPASFSTGSGAVEFTVTNGGQKIAFTEQAKPSAQDLQNFASSRIPLHININTPVGTALLGAIGNNSVVSLPTNGSTWLLAFAPSNLSQTSLEAVLNSLTR